MSEKRAKRARQTGRREFLKNVLVGGGAAVATIASGGVAAAPKPKAQTAQAKTESQGYHETAHILEYYKAAQF